jgi:hypothetical protein
MQAIKIGNIEFDGELSNTDPYIIGVFGAEGTGKTRFGLTGPEVIGCVPLEMKAYKTISEVCGETGKRVFKPKDPSSLLVPIRRVNSMEDAQAKKFYREHLKRVNDVIYGMLEHPDVRTIMIDKWTTYVTWVQFAVNGMTGKKIIKIGDKMFQDNKEFNQEVIDVMNSFSQYGKTVVLLNSDKVEYADDKPTGRMINEGFKYLGSHTNVLVHLENNKFWKPKDEGNKWKFRLNVRTAQGATHLEGPEGNPLLSDGDINIQNLIYNIEGDEKFVLEDWQ